MNRIFLRNGPIKVVLIDFLEESESRSSSLLPGLPPWAFAFGLEILREQVRTDGRSSVRGRISAEMDSQQAPCTTRHPFLNGLAEFPIGRKKELQKIRTWMLSQAHLPTISDEYIYLFLHACYYHLDRTRHAIETYFTLRTATPALFSDRDVFSNRIKTCMEIA